MRSTVVISVLLVISASYVQIRAQSPKADSKEKDCKRKDKSQNKADAVADKILAETSEVAPSWYGDVYPALKRKYNKPVSRELYDRWRKRYYENVVVPQVLKDGYNLESARQEFMKQTEKQPSN